MTYKYLDSISFVLPPIARVSLDIELRYCALLDHIALPDCVTLLKYITSIDYYGTGLYYVT